MNPPFNKILIANRGEIAVRIIQACREMGIGTVAIYSSVDEACLHVQLADEAYCVGPAPALESYLNGPNVLAAARSSGAGAVHPGYGFLAENADFARSVEAAGLVWIGPTPTAIALMGDKVAAKDLARSIGLTVVPGYEGIDQSLQAFEGAAANIGFPLLVKAVAGGGGRGMRLVDQVSGLESAIEGARREALAAFGDDRVFLEKVVENPRHVEVQVVLDTLGAGIHLGERDCSLQRRHQKIVEECPSPAIAGDVREAMGQDALKLARAARYTNVGTVEFLYSDGLYYFLEMNTRIQVEHPVTEMSTGIDLVRLQIELAAGKELTLGQSDVRLTGHSIEARLYAEDPWNAFLPSSGVLNIFQPPEGAGIRNDVGVYESAEVSNFYDPLLAKLVVHGPDRATAVKRLNQALARYGLLGPRTNLDFLHWLTMQSDFVSGEVDINWVERNWRPIQNRTPFPALVAAALVEVSLPASPRQREEACDPWLGKTSWRNSPFHTVSLNWKEETYRVELIRVGTKWKASEGDRQGEFDVSFAGHSVVMRDGAHVDRLWVSHSSDQVQASYKGTSWSFARQQDLRTKNVSRTSDSSESSAVAPMPGTVVKVNVERGSHVDKHEPLAVIEAMKMEHVVAAPRTGVVKAVLVHEGESVSGGASIVELEID